MFDAEIVGMAAREDFEGRGGFISKREKTFTQRAYTQTAFTPPCCVAVLSCGEVPLHELTSPYSQTYRLYREHVQSDAVKVATNTHQSKLPGAHHRLTAAQTGRSHEDLVEAGDGDGSERRTNERRGRAASDRRRLLNEEC